MKIKIIIYSIFLLSTLLFGSICLGKNILEMKDVPVVYNIDSMVSQIPVFQKNTRQYIDHLITIENSRILYGSYKQGRYLHEIDSLSQALNDPLGQAFYAYGSAILYNYYSPENTQKPIKFAETALQLFSVNHDTTGIFLSNVLMAKTYQGYLRYLDNNNFKSKAQPVRDSIQKIIKNVVLYYLDKASDIASNSEYPALKIQFFYEQADMLGNLSDNKEDIKKMLRNGVNLIGQYPANNYWLVAYYNLIGNTLVDQDSISQAIFYHTKAIQCGPHRESDFNYVLYNNIGSDYDDLKIADSAICYYQKSLLKLAENKEGDPRVEILVHNQMAENFERLHKIQEALTHKKIACNLLQKANDKSLLNAFNLQKNNEILKEKEIREKTLEVRNKNAELKLLIGTGLLIVLAFSSLLIYYSRKKLNYAYHKIQELQISREKFYSIVAHDLRSHIDSYQDMAGMVSYLLKLKKYSQIEKIALQIDKTGLLLKNLLQNLFQWSLSQKENLLFDPEIILLNEFIQHTAEIYRPIADKKNVQFDVSFDNAYTVNTDKNHLETILRNLIDNAIKNSPTGSRITVEGLRNNNNILLKISNRANINADKLNTIETLFNTKQNWQVGQQGLGLGLILIRDFAIKMKCRMQVQYENEILSFSMLFPQA
jgi:signal transduction histidine kinase